MNGGSNPHREREGPGQQSADDKKGQAVQESLPYLSKHRLVVFPGDDPAGEQIPIEQQVLGIEGFVQVEFRTHAFDDFRGKFGVERIDLARFAGG
jgi:hypothetical protein